MTALYPQLVLGINIYDLYIHSNTFSGGDPGGGNKIKTDGL